MNYALRITRLAKVGTVAALLLGLLFPVIGHAQATSRLTVNRLRFDEDSNRWHIGTEQGHSVTANFVVAATGSLDAANVPAFPGLDAQNQALEYGSKVSGCTVHFVDEHLDHGPIILQRAVPVLDDDTVEVLSARILKEEHVAYSEAIRMVLAGAWNVEGRRVVFENISRSQATREL